MDGKITQQIIPNRVVFGIILNFDNPSFDKNRTESCSLQKGKTYEIVLYWMVFS